MNPENNALARTYFIGGPPRIGKTILSFALAEKIKGHVVSTDAIRDAVKKVATDKTGDMFMTRHENSLSEGEWLKEYTEHPEMVINNRIKESVAVWDSIVAFCGTFCDDDSNHIVEGVALLPHLVANMKNRPVHVVYVGNTQKTAESMLKHMENNPQRDWMAARKYTRERVEGKANVVRAMSQYFKTEAEKYGFPYYEIDDKNFDQSIEKIVADLTK